MKVGPRRNRRNAPSLSLFAWADARANVRPTPYAVRWLRRRRPELSPALAQLIAEHAGIGGADGR